MGRRQIIEVQHLKGTLAPLPPMPTATQKLAENDIGKQGGGVSISLSRSVSLRFSSGERSRERLSVLLFISSWETIALILNKHTILPTYESSQNMSWPLAGLGPAVSIIYMIVVLCSLLRPLDASRTLEPRTPANSQTQKQYHTHIYHATSLKLIWGVCVMLTIALQERYFLEYS